ncbi:MAG TPA: ATPase [Gammaproteobacteria bacterium]|nr:ATPase [Gammaproteobacteria bacterium]
MRFTAEEFRHWPRKRITLLGMSGVGKTVLSSMMRENHWFHYSGDYRIGTRYLDEPILDNIKYQAMQVPFLKDLLRSDSISISNKITFDHLKPVSSFLGKIGNPELGGLSKKEFIRRQRLHHQAEVSAMLDVPEFIQKAEDIYGYKNFVNDAGGSLCELDNESVLKTLSDNTLILYLKASKKNEEELIARAESSPKPLYYREDFLEQHLAQYMQQNDIAYVALIDPDDFVQWVFPYLFKSRIPRYEAIAKQYGYTVLTDELMQIKSVDDFMSLIETAIERQ